MLAAIGFGKYSARQVLNRLAPGILHQQPTPDDPALPTEASLLENDAKRLQLQASAASDTLEVEGSNELLVYRARCSNPNRGEEIVGYVTRGKGVAVHGRICPNVQNLLYESDRRIAVEWAREGRAEPGVTARRATYPVKLTVVCDDRPGMLKEITAPASEENTNIRSMDTRSGSSGEAWIELTLDAQDLRHLERLQQGLRRIPGVREVQRSSKL